jgi:hypothetical protein
MGTLKTTFKAGTDDRGKLKAINKKVKSRD